MKKIIVFTDIHIVPEGQTIIGLDPAARFARALADALARHPDAERIVLCGDLTHHGAPAEYARLRHLLQGCPLPISPMLGNHDRRAAFLAEFADTPLTAQGYVQRVVDIGSDRLILMDTLDEGAEDLHSGWLCAERLAWLEQALQGGRDKRVTVFTHHPPMRTGFGGMDAVGLRNQSALIAQLGRYPNVAQIVSGHIHRTISGSAGGIPVAIFKSPCHQMPMVLDAHDTSLSIDEPGAYGLLLLDEGGVIVHTQDVDLPAQAPQSYGASR